MENYSGQSALESHADHKLDWGKLRGSLSVDVASLWIRHKANFLPFLLCFPWHICHGIGVTSSDQTQRSTPDLQPANRLHERNEYFGGMTPFVPR